MIGTVIVDTWVNGGNDSLEKFEASSVHGVIILNYNTKIL